MKIQCNVCEAAEAVVLCCADEAALCWNCDRKVHAANKLAGKHQRVLLSSSSSQLPKCDICQETVGYFFCLEDRALLCRKCDVAVHTANPLVSVHQRFVLTGVKVGLEAAETPPPSSSSVKTNTNTAEKMPEQERDSPPKRTTPVSLSSQYSKSVPVQASPNGDTPMSKLPFAGGSSPGNISQWHLDEFMGFGDFTENYNFMDNGSSKADSGKLGDSDCSQTVRLADGEFEGDDCLGQVPETFWAVPQITSPPTASGLYWPKNFQNTLDSSVFVPDIIPAPFHNFQQDQSNITKSKRRRHF